jgi:two-component system OmpR family response regulator
MVDVMRVLLIEDDSSVADFVASELALKGHNCECASTGTEGLLAANSARWDALIVDRMLPKLDGLSVIKSLRDKGDLTPVLILSALGEVDDRVKGLQIGADDYLVKPFSSEELMARLEAIHRRLAPLVADFRTTLEAEDLRLDLITQEVRRAGRVIALQPREYRLLEYLMRNAGKIVTRSMLLENVWGYHFDPQTNVIDVHISRLRQKIDRDFDYPLVHTVRGAGYRFGDE